MDALEAILTRCTVPQLKMTPPGPDPDELRRILEAGAAAPDHGKLRPWRFLVVEGTARERLGSLFVAALRKAQPTAGDEEIAKQQTAPLRAPVIIVVVALLDGVPHAKIPEAERLASAAAAAQNILLAAHAMGFAGKWSTGKNAYDETVRSGLGLSSTERITGFLYIGSHAAAAPPSPRPALGDIVAKWPG